MPTHEALTRAPEARGWIDGKQPQIGRFSLLISRPANQAESSGTPARGLAPEPGLRRHFAAAFAAVLLALVLLSAGILQLAKGASRDRLLQAIETAERQAVAAMQQATQYCAGQPTRWPARSAGRTWSVASVAMSSPSS